MEGSRRKLDGMEEVEEKEKQVEVVLEDIVHLLLGKFLVVVGQQNLLLQLVQ